MPQEQQQRILKVLATLEGDCKYKNRDEFIGILTDAFTGAQVNITTAQLKLIYQSLGSMTKPLMFVPTARENQNPIPI